MIAQDVTFLNADLGVSVEIFQALKIYICRRFLNNANRLVSPVLVYCSSIFLSFICLYIYKYLYIIKHYKLQIFCFYFQNFNVKLWWPNGLGDQPTYFIKTIFSTLEETANKTIQFGFRTIELIQEPIPTSPGNAYLIFFFLICI